MIKITTIETKSYKLCMGINHELKSRCTINWGDGVISLISNLNQATHKYKKKGVYEIVVTNLDTNIFTFENDQLVRRIEGVLPFLPDKGIARMFSHAINLEYVDPEFFSLNDHQTDATALCFGCERLKSVEFLKKLRNLENINYFLCGTQSTIDLSPIYNYDWAVKVRYACGAFSNRKYISEPDENVLSRMEKLEVADFVFSNIEHMNVCRNYFVNNLELKSINGAFRGCNIREIDPNWLYYLPSSVETNVEDIFDENFKCKLNGR